MNDVRHGRIIKLKFGSKDVETDEVFALPLADAVKLELWLWIKQTTKFIKATLNFHGVTVAGFDS